MNIAKETGWDEDHILNMSFSKAWGYQHAILRSYGKDTQFITNNEEREDLFKLFDSL